jgi:hypothetical protein
MAMTAKEEFDFLMRLDVLIRQHRIQIRLAQPLIQ